MSLKRWSLVAAVTCSMAACGGAESPEEMVDESMTVEMDASAPDFAMDEAGVQASAEAARGNGPCGDAYTRLVRHTPIGDLAHLDIYYSPSNDRYCAVNMATANTWDSRRGRSIAVREGRNPSRQSDSGRYLIYAGPIYVSKAASGCIKLAASVQVTPTSDLGIGSYARVCD
ncbi:hypothetical protein [Pyxidicoccus xibeiensis]|uniref:hypothetical protein n=1 Tax=Pyxidicoccus xibeiensis TaxID=2906759 RepID=UPI0020A7B0D5|nr:hypothetical protein [Pyxidicoccus xibeiensis]MCP3137779.1 hypothetical protein [Pyxidicoccus xibeiensis]